MRIATVFVSGWWLLAARGYASLDNIFNVVFLVGCGWLLVTLFGPSARADADGPGTH